MPTGDKDPYAMRRSALGILSILMSEKLEITLDYLIESSLRIFISNSTEREVAIKKCRGSFLTVCFSSSKNKDLEQIVLWHA